MPDASRTPRYTLLQLSDVHLTPGGEPLHDRVDTDAHLESAVHAAADSGLAVHGVLLTGDLADGGSPAAYRRLRAAVEPWATAIGAPVIYAMGNHDARAAFRAELVDRPTGDDHPTGDDRRPDDRPYDTVHWIGELRIVVLDSTTPGRPDGDLTEAQLAWLHTVLQQPAPDGTVLVLHHPPVPSPVPLVEMIALRAPERLAAVVAGSDVRIILSGHAHHTACGMLAGIPVWVCPATAYGADLLPPAGRVHAIATSACSRIDLFADTVVASVIPLGAVETVFDHPESDLPLLLGLADLPTIDPAPAPAVDATANPTADPAVGASTAVLAAASRDQGGPQ